MITCHNISLSFPGKPILHNFNLTVDRGKRVCISGPSGRGKSTLLKLIQGYHTPASGEVQVNGATLNQRTAQSIRRSITWIPQNINLPVSNGRELMELLSIVGSKQTASGYLQQLGLEPSIIGQDFQQISGGQKQRVVIAICLSMGKEIVLMDEPTSSLDDASIDLLTNTIASLKGITVLSASHNHRWLENSQTVINL